MSIRQLALANPESTYFRNVNAIILSAMMAHEKSIKSRRRVLIPFKVPAESVAEYERVFGWKIEVENHGLRSAHSAHVAGLAYCMALRNTVALGSDGQEIICVDGDLPLLIAKGATYAKVVRTSSSNRLTTGYMMEESQLGRLANSGNVSVRNAANVMLQELCDGGGSRVFYDACDVGIKGDVITLDHTRTSMSLLQAVACAHAWGASTVRGVCFFQPEMLAYNTGPLSAFPGEYVIQEEKDVITFVPEESPESCFSHSWSALRSFFLNHECVYEGRTWLVEKHLGSNGIFHYVITRAAESWQFAAELGANYYSADLADWVELEYPSRGGVASGASAVYWRREKVRILKSLYDQVVAIMMSVDPKRLTREEVLATMRAYNNNTVVAGDTVRKPLRVLAVDEAKAATPILALVVCRRAAASAECSKVLGELRRRYNVASEGVLTLFWEVCCSVAEFAKDVSVTTAFGAESANLQSLVDGSVDMSVLVKSVPAMVTVNQVVGLGKKRDCGRLTPGLPGSRPAFVTELLARAKRFAEVGAGMFQSGCVAGSESDSATEYPSDSEQGHEGTGGGAFVVEQEEFVPMERAKREGVAGKLFDKLVAEQDAADFVRVPRRVTRYESKTEAPDIECLTILQDAAVMQEDYDDGFPGVSLDDAEVVPYVASNSDTQVVLDAHMVVNNSKREIAKPKWVRRAKGRAGAAGMLPRTQGALLSALRKRNGDVPVNRASVDFEEEPLAAVRAIQRVCYVSDWRDRLAAELKSGLWMPTEDDLSVYVGKVEVAKAEAMLQEYFSVADVDMRRWLMMVKGKAKPPLDPGANEKVPLPQTIMYNESKGMNAMYSSIMSRFHDVVDSLMKPNVKFNDRRDPVEHEIWFNTLQPLRASAKKVYAYQGDSYNFDRSQELFSATVELLFYREHGLDRETLDVWKQTMGVKRAVSLMHGILMHITLQGLSGIFKTLFRNGLVTLASVVDATCLRDDMLCSLDVKGDDYTLETFFPVDVEHAVKVLAWRYNFSAKLWGCDYLYFCSRYWVHVDGWWYWVADPERKYESLCAAVAVNERGEDTLSEKWISLRVDLRHYNNGLVAEELASAVLASNPRRSKRPLGLIGGLANLAENRDDFFAFYGPAEIVGG